MKLYTSTAVDNLFNKYINRGGNIITLQEGTLGHGKAIAYAPNSKLVVVEEVAINEWSSGHKVRFYNKPPQKYLAHIY